MREELTGVNALASAGGVIVLVDPQAAKNRVPAMPKASRLVK